MLSSSRVRTVKRHCIVQVFEVIRETEKALRVRVLGCRDGEPDTVELWLPKSQVKMKDGVLVVPSWLMLAKEDEAHPVGLFFVQDDERAFLGEYGDVPEQDEEFEDEMFYLLRDELH